MTEINTFTIFFSRINHFSMNIQVFLKCIQRGVKINNTITMTIWVFSINYTKIPLRNNQWNIRDNTIKYVLINIFILYIIIPITTKIHNNPVIVYSQKLKALKIINHSISQMITWVFNFLIPGNNKLFLTWMETIVNYSNNNNDLN